VIREQTEGDKKIQCEVLHCSSIVRVSFHAMTHFDGIAQVYTDSGKARLFI